MNEAPMDIQKAAGMCAQHGNVPNTCPSCNIEKQRSDSEALPSIEEHSEQYKPHLIRKESGEQEIVVVGMVHTNEREKAKPLIDEFEQMNPNLVLVEGQPLEAVFPRESFDDIMKKNGEDVLRDRGEQVYLLWLAKKQGKEVRYWDAPMRKQVEGVLKMKNEDGSAKHTIKDIQEWATVYGVRSLYGMVGKDSKHKDLTDEELRPLMEAGVPGVEAPTASQIDDILIRVTGHSLEGLASRASEKINETEEEKNERKIRRDEDFEKVRDFSEPGTNKVFGDMCAIRDAHALEVIRQAKQDGFKKIFVGAGRSHAELWDESITRLYKI